MAKSRITRLEHLEKQTAPDSENVHVVIIEGATGLILDEGEWITRAEYEEREARRPKRGKVRVKILE